MLCHNICPISARAGTRCPGGHRLRKSGAEGSTSDAPVRDAEREFWNTKGSEIPIPPEAAGRGHTRRGRLGSRVHFEAREWMDANVPVG